MLINKCIKGVAVAFAALAMTSCASDYLDTPTHGSVPAENICATPERARQAMLGVFGRGMSAPWTVGQNTPAQALAQGETGFSQYLGEIPGSDCYVNFIFNEAPSWNILYNQVEGYLSSGSYVWNVGMWIYSYALIAQCNEILATIDAAETGGEADQIALRDFTKAQALTMRAHCYWRLLQTYGPRWVDSKQGEALTVVLRLAPGESQHKAAASMNEVINQCYSDLNTAIDLFTAAGRSFRTLNYEIDQNVAYGVYARIAALKNDWNTVRTMAHNARQGKRIATSQEIFSGYMSYNQNEWMWSPSFDQIDNWIYGNYCTFMACNSYGANNDRYTNSINRDLYELIPEGDERANWWLTYDKLPGLRPAMFYQPTGVNPETGAFKNNRMLTAARTWLDEHTPANVTGDKAYANASTSDKTSSIIRDGAQVKFWVNGLTGQTDMCEIPYMRATEMYLYEAEACAELGLDTEARALLMEINGPRNPNYSCANLTGQALVDEVRLYRRIELWGEGFCWFDLKRWNLPMVRTAWKANDVNSGNIPTALECNVPVDRNKGWRHGIPSSERSYNNLITQPIPGEVVEAPDEVE